MDRDVGQFRHRSTFVSTDIAVSVAVKLAQN